MRSDIKKMIEKLPSLKDKLEAKAAEETPKTPKVKKVKIKVGVTKKKQKK